MCLEEDREPGAAPCVSKCLQHGKPSVRAVGKETAPVANSMKAKRCQYYLLNHTHVDNIVLRKIVQNLQNVCRREPLM